MTPTTSYRIWFTPRTGSTLLCKGLESTGIAGQPGEFLNLINGETLREKYNVSNYEELKSTIWNLGTSPNGVFGLKHSRFTSRTRILFEELLQLRGLNKVTDINEEEVWSHLFPNSQHIFLTRRNKIRQAVSWWKAINDNVWHLQTGKKQESEASFYEKKYDFNALNHLFKEAMLRECTIQAYFSKHQISPLTLVYEDFVQDFEATIKSIINYLNIDYDQVNIGEKYYNKTANDYSEEWVQRFRKELQEKMGHEIW